MKIIKSDLVDDLILEKYLKSPSMTLMEMANMVGNLVKTDKIPFSFYFNDKNAVHNLHGIRVKILWNPSKSSSDVDGYMELHGDYDYVSGSHKYNPTADELKIAGNFFSKYKVLFAAVWEKKIDPHYLQEYFRGNIMFKELLTKFENASEKQFYYMNHCNTLNELEEIVRKYKVFNMND